MKYIYIYVYIICSEIAFNDGMSYAQYIFQNCI
jgi:hypothetical protein